MKWVGSGFSSDGPQQLRIEAAVALFDSRLDIHLRVLGMFDPGSSIEEVKEQVLELMERRARACLDDAIKDFHRERLEQIEWNARFASQPGPSNGPP